MQGICTLPATAIRGGSLLLVAMLAGCTAWSPEPDPVDPEPIIVDAPPPEPLLEPAPEPEPEPVIEVPVEPGFPPIAIVLTSSQPAYRDVAVELAGRFEDHSVYDLSDQSIPPVSILRSINDSNAVAIVAIGLRAAQSSVAISGLPVVFSQVFNYREHELLAANSRGIAPLAPMQAQLHAWKQVDPELQKVGLIIGEGHDDLIASADAAAEQNGIELDVRIAHSDQESLYLFRRMISDIDGFWLLPDNRILSTRVLTEMLDEAKRHSVDVVVPNESMLQIGATMSISTVASDIAASIAKVLRKIQAGEIEQVPPITELSEVRVTVNDASTGELE